MPGQDRSTVRWLARGGLLVYWLVMFAATHLPPPAILVAVDRVDEFRSAYESLGNWKDGARQAAEHILSFIADR